MAAISSTENDMHIGSAESEAAVNDFSGHVGEKSKSRLHFENTIFNQITCLMQHSIILVYLNFISYIQSYFLDFNLSPILCSFTVLTSET